VNKNDLLDKMTALSGMTKTDSEKALNAMVGAVTDALKSGEEVSLVGFGKFYVTERKATVGRNPQTGDTINIAASNQPKFKAGKALKDACN
jgi:DNA-binding protein HU-beta